MRFTFFLCILLICSMLTFVGCAQQEDNAEATRDNVVIGLSSDMTTFNPLNSATKSDDSVISQIYDQLYFYDDGNIKSIITDIVGHWQNKLGAFINIETASSAEKLTPQLKNRDLPISVFPIRADSKSLSEFAEKFGISAKGKTPDAVQAELLRGTHIIPLLFQNTTVAYSSALSDVYTVPGDGYIDFSFIVKTEK